MDLFGQNFDHDYYFELLPKEERAAQSIARWSTSHHRDVRAGPRANRTFLTELKRNSNGTWTENILYMFSGNGPDGVSPDSTLVFDGAGNLYGTTDQGGNMNCAALYGCGVAFKLTRDPGESWSESVLYTFGSETNLHRREVSR